ncbi:MAG: glycosyltransferase family 4 protein [Gloeotrichia echinulata GP01]
MRKLLILPGACNAVGGTVVTLSLLIQGFEQLKQAESLCVLVQADSVMEKYLLQAGQGAYLKSIAANSQSEFCTKALKWVNQQPTDYPLLLDNCVDRRLQLILLWASPRLRWSGRQIFHFFHDLALSYNYAGYLLRKLMFANLAPVGICNSNFTAQHVRQFVSDIRGIMYQPVATVSFQSQVKSHPPSELQPILESGAKIILTPSRINQPHSVNDKNLRALIPVLAHLHASGHKFHGVVIGQDLSPNQIYTQELLKSAKNAGVADYFTVLAPTLGIQNYYNYADIVVSLAPREPFGRIIVEAIAFGVPVVGSCTGGIGEILSHFAPEWIVDPHDPKAVCEAIIRISNHQNTSEVLAQAKNWVTQNCTVSKYTQKMMQITELTSINNHQKELNQVY